MYVPTLEEVLEFIRSKDTLTQELFYASSQILVELEQRIIGKMIELSSTSVTEKDQFPTKNQ